MIESNGRIGNGAPQKKSIVSLKSHSGPVVIASLLVLLNGGCVDIDQDLSSKSTSRVSVDFDGGDNVIQNPAYYDDVRESDWSEKQVFQDACEATYIAVSDLRDKHLDPEDNEYSPRKLFPMARFLERMEEWCSNMRIAGSEPKDRIRFLKLADADFEEDHTIQEKILTMRRAAHSATGFNANMPENPPLEYSPDYPDAFKCSAAYRKWILVDKTDEDGFADWLVQAAVPLAICYKDAIM